MTSMIAEFLTGFRYLTRGAGLILRRPRLALLGMLPPLLVSAAMVILIALLGFFGIGPLTEAVTGWVPDGIRMAARVFLGVVIMAVAVVIAVITFASLTLAIGSPIYDRISYEVERELQVYEPYGSEPMFAGILRSIWQSVCVILLSAVCGFVIFLFGLIPLIGVFLSVPAGAIIGGYFLTVEMISGPFDRRGRVGLGEKFGAVRSAPARVAGFGIPTFLIFSVPMLSVFLFPAATAAAALLAHDLRHGKENFP